MHDDGWVWPILRSASAFAPFAFCSQKSRETAALSVLTVKSNEQLNQDLLTHEGTFSLHRLRADLRAGNLFRVMIWISETCGSFSRGHLRWFYFRFALSTQSFKFVALQLVDSELADLKLAASIK